MNLMCQRLTETRAETCPFLELLRDVNTKVNKMWFILNRPELLEMLKTIAKEDEPCGPK